MVRSEVTPARAHVRVVNFESEDLSNSMFCGPGFNPEVSRLKLPRDVRELRVQWH